MECYNDGVLVKCMPIEQWNKIQERLLWLDCLEEAGVDNWGGIEYAQEAYSNSINKKE